MNRVLCVVIIVMLVACGVLSLGLNHYRDNAITYKAQRDKKVSELKLANATITDMQQRQRDVAALDARYTKELADARMPLNAAWYPLHYNQCVERPYYPCAVLSPYSCINRDRSPTGRLLCASVRG